jgi:hypothetical protein
MKRHLSKHPKIALIYGLFALFMLPWAFNLARVLPQRHLAENWDMVWFGFDLIMAVVFFLTAYGLYKRRYWVPVTASIAATMVFCDAWFDVGTARTSDQLFGAIILALIIEIPIGILSFWLALDCLNKEVPKSFKA